MATIYKNKEEAITAISKNKILDNNNLLNKEEITLNDIINLLKDDDSYYSNYPAYYSYRAYYCPLEDQKNIIAFYNDEDGKLKSYSIFDYFGKSGLSKKAILDAAKEIDTSKSKDATSLYLTILLAGTFANEATVLGKYRDAIKIIKELYLIMADVIECGKPDTVYNIRFGFPSYSYHDDDGLKLTLFAIIALMDAERSITDYKLLDKSCFKRVQNELVEEYVACVLKSGINIDKNLINYHKRVLYKFNSTFKKGIAYNSKLMSKEVLFNIDYLETSPSTLDWLLDSINNAVGWRALHSNSTEIRILRESINGDYKRLSSVLKNYLYSKYGKGSKTFLLKDRILAIEKLIEYLGFSDSITIIELVDELPDKIKSAALAAQLGED